MNKQMNGPDSIYDHIAFFLDLLIIQKTEIYTIFTINN